MATPIQLRKVQAYITNSAYNLNSKDLDEAFQVNPTEFAFQVNNFLRANLATPAMEKYLEDLDELCQTDVIYEKLTVHRACNYLEMLPTMMCGNYLDRGYMSTSLDKKVIMHFFNGNGYYIPAYIQIDLPEGAQVLFLDGIRDLSNHTYEKEVLIRRRAAFKIEEEEKLIKGGEVPAEFRCIVDHYKEMYLIKLRFIQYL